MLEFKSRNSQLLGLRLTSEVRQGSEVEEKGGGE
jgi:hypothetical protein